MRKLLLLLPLHLIGFVMEIQTPASSQACQYLYYWTDEDKILNSIATGSDLAAYAAP